MTDSHHNSLASAQEPNDIYLESTLIRVGQRSHQLLHCRILGGRWWQPHGAGCIRNPVEPVQLEGQ